MVKKECQGKTLKWIASVGYAGFITCYIVAAVQYPGGSDFHVNSSGFSVLENYWCELLSDYSKNGNHNNAQPYAFAALVFMNLALVTSWMYIGGTRTILENTDSKLIISGILSTVCTNFVNTKMHDVSIALSIGFGCFSIVRLIKNYPKNRKFFVGMGYLNLFLILINCLLYYFSFGLHMLPLIQKITFLSVLVWLSLNLHYKTISNSLL
jgi:hypothetical protein